MQECIAVRLYSKLKEMKIPLVFYRAENIHANFKEPFVLAFNALVRKLLSLERGTLTAKEKKSGEKTQQLTPFFLRLFLRS